MSVTTIKPDQWYGIDSNMIVCGECAQQMIDDTNAGKFTGDERVTLDMFERITDSDTEGYQCDNCLEQNAAYDENFEEDND